MRFLGKLRIRDRFLVQNNVHSKVEIVLHLQFVHLGRFYKVFPRVYLPVSTRNGNIPHRNWASNERSVLLRFKSTYFSTL